MSLKNEPVSVPQIDLRRHKDFMLGHMAGEICTRKVDVRLPGKWNSNSHGARPVHLIIR